MDTLQSHEAAEISELRRALETSSLEVSYEKTRRRTDIILEEEKVRRVRLQKDLIQDENDGLQEQLAQDDGRIDELEKVTKELQGQLQETDCDLRTAQGRLRGKTREVDTLKAELGALDGMSSDSAKLLTEKLALTRELSSMKPELEHLRSQTETHHSLISEKLSLQRQLSTAQVELEMEKRATQRYLAKEEKNTENEGRLELQIEELRKELALERRDRQKLEQDAQKELASWEGRKAVLEGKLDAFRNKLRTTKEQLRQTEAELSKAQTSATTLTYQGDYEMSMRNPRKRSASHLDIDATIGTPGVLPTAKHGKRGSTLPGDKSTFSITPFLNRTASVAPDTPREEQRLEHIGEHHEQGPTPAIPTRNAPATVSTTSIPVLPKSKVSKRTATAKAATETHSLGTAKTGKINTKAPPSRKRPGVQSLENVEEEQNDENEPPPEVPATTEEIPQNSEAQFDSHALGEQIERKRRKRKLLGTGLGKTLFDDDDGEAIKAGARGPLGVVRGLGVLGKGALAGPKGSIRLGPASSVGVFGSFSPLKKDKRASTER
ncbi:MAG: hypothetical protein M1830_008078 [Pleopsidium flavum]|nr:MAG: hypothetical protein M1830_008078 [Pleopsidium flavum]